MSILEISTTVFPTLTLVWKYLQVNLQFHIYSAPHEEWTISIHPSSEDLEIKDRPNEDWKLQRKTLSIAFKNEWTISMHPSSEDLGVKDRTSEDWFSLVDAERERPLRTTNPTAS
ncbi:hypothetical protein NC653_028607 [Populus alba x Populus x berolinensis]|uniref:Uncharacterized protein n=1 Tax=Populus alba x Populus x berolinensis TaxID=444605 RepID=A0AAD6M2Y4_9ROSI|nr:hypothetical protein NC653_028607 [Populus alba x Populus x berolinensis]